MVTMQMLASKSGLGISSDVLHRVFMPDAVKLCLNHLQWHKMSVEKLTNKLWFIANYRQSMKHQAVHEFPK